LVIEQESLVNHSIGGSLAGSLVLLLLVIRILHPPLPYRKYMAMPT
jgi:hypothetical protein